MVLAQKEKAEIDKDYNEAKKAYEDAAKEVALQYSEDET